MDRDTLLKFRLFLESAPWLNFEDFLQHRLEVSHAALEACELEKVERFRGEIKVLRELLGLRKAAQASYRESKENG